MEFGVAYPAGVDSNGDIALNYGVRGIPEKFFVDANGIIRHKYVGPMPEDILQGDVGQAAGGGRIERRLKRDW